jgi:hypothetical protein
MQSISVYLYPNKLDAHTNSVADWKTERYRRVYNRNIKVYRGVDNRIDLQVRNSDQKPKDVTASAVVFTLLERDQQKKVFEKDCNIVSALNGRFFVNLSESDLDNIEPGFYQYSLRTEQRISLTDGNYQVSNSSLLYTDSQYGAIGIVEIFGSIQGEPLPSVEIKEFNRIVDFQEAKTRFTSSFIDARPETSTPQKLHTFQIFPTNYTGIVTIEGSLDNGASPSNWVDLDSETLHVSSETFYFNIVGKYNWFRVRHDAESDEIDGTFIVTQGTYSLEYDVVISNGGKDYTVGEQFVIQGRNLGGESPTHNLTVTVTGVDQNGSITDITWTGVSQNGVRIFVVNARDPDLVGSVDRILYR